MNCVILFLSSTLLDSSMWFNCSNLLLLTVVNYFTVGTFHNLSILLLAITNNSAAYVKVLFWHTYAWVSLEDILRSQTDESWKFCTFQEIPIYFQDGCGNLCSRSSQYNCYFKQDTFIIQSQLLIQHPTTLVNTAIAIKSYVLNPCIYQSYCFYKPNTSNHRETTTQYGLKMIPMQVLL